jgi:dephospho-CoA kinase
MLLAALTGNIASGKSTVAALLAQRGATIIDADVLARRAVEPGSAALRAIVDRWGAGVVAEDGTLDRAGLRRIVFGRPGELEALNAIVHPEVARLRDEEVAAARARGDRIIICDIPLLFEAGLEDGFDRIILVDAPPEVRLDRLVRDRGMDAAEARRMIAAQMPAEHKRGRVDFIVENVGDRRELDARVGAVWSALERDARARDGG